MPRFNQILTSNNSIAPKIFIKENGDIIPSESNFQPHKIRNAFKNNFFSYNAEKDLLFFDSVSAAGLISQRFTLNNSYHFYKNAFKAYIEEGAIHADGIKIVFDRPIDSSAIELHNNFVHLGKFVQINGTNSTFCLEHEEREQLLHPQGSGYFNLEGYDKPIYQEWIVAFKLEGRKVVKIEAAENSCNLSIEGDLPLYTKSPDEFIYLDFRATESAMVEEKNAHSLNVEKDTPIEQGKNIEAQMKLEEAAAGAPVDAIGVTNPPIADIDFHP